MTPVLLREVRLLYHENAFGRTWFHDQSGIFGGSSLGFDRTSVLHQVKALTERRSSIIPQGKPAIGSGQLQGVPNAQVQFHSAGQERMVGHPDLSESVIPLNDNEGVGADAVISLRAWGQRQICRAC
ncbi:hypothetical protein [Glutamicibacter sp. BSL13]